MQIDDLFNALQISLYQYRAINNIKAMNIYRRGNYKTTSMTSTINGSV